MNNIDKLSLQMSIDELRSSAHGKCDIYSMILSVTDVLQELLEVNIDLSNRLQEAELDIDRAFEYMRGVKDEQ